MPLIYYTTITTIYITHLLYHSFTALPLYYATLYHATPLLSHNHRYHYYHYYWCYESDYSDYTSSYYSYTNNDYSSNTITTISTHSTNHSYWLFHRYHYGIIIPSSSLFSISYHLIYPFCVTVYSMYPPNSVYTTSPFSISISLSCSSIASNPVVKSTSLGFFLYLVRFTNFQPIKMAMSMKHIKYENKNVCTDHHPGRKTVYP